MKGESTVSETNTEFDVVEVIAQEIQLPAPVVRAVIQLFEGGATVPFIARYRKEVTQGLDEVQIRTIEERRGYLQELGKRREVILAAISEQGKLSPLLAEKIANCGHKQALEDLYLPYKKKRKTKGMIALEKGLGPLADRIVGQPNEGDPGREAESFIDPAQEIVGVDDALRFARDIVVDRIVEDPEVRSLVRRRFSEDGVLRTSAAPGKDQERSKFEDYYTYEESAAKIPSHRYLAIRRGEKEGVIRSRIELDAAVVLPQVERRVGVREASPFADQLRKATRMAFVGRLSVGVETDVRVELKGKADEAAVEVFADNLKNLLLAAPLGSKAVIGIDPGLRTGCKCVAVDATGKFLETITIFLARGETEVERARSVFRPFVEKHGPVAIAVGNGTGGRETEKFVRDLFAADSRTSTMVVSVSEAGASIYSASDVAREEFPDLDLTIRGAISIARRLQDPLAELVKLEPKSIGVGQYQHDVFQSLLVRKLHEVVESCVNKVGVELNTASASLLSYLAGVGKSLALKIVEHRDTIGAFSSREALLDVPGMGPRTYEQAVGFLRVRESENPLDRSGVHPERYGLVARIARDMGRSVSELVGDSRVADSIDIARYIDDEVGEPTLKDIVEELKKPGRDPRQGFELVRFREDVHEMKDLRDGMRLEGVVTNVTAFGAFVDVGVHQDGLVHISQLSDSFVQDPSQVVKVGQRIKVHVLSVDLERKRIALSARAKDPKTSSAPRGEREGNVKSEERKGRRSAEKQQGSGQAAKGSFSNNPFAGIRRR